MARFGRNSEKNATLSTRRLEAFSDGVFAIAATLLVLDLSVDKLGTSITSNDELFQALIGQDSLVTFTSFVTSFVLLVFFWSIHVRQFEWIVAVDGLMIFLNNARLFFVVLIPFTTSLNSTFNDFLVALVIMPVNFVMVSLTGTLLWDYARWTPRRTFDDRLTAAEKTASSIHGWVAVGLGLIIVATAPIFGAWAFALYALNFPIGAALARWRNGRSGGPSDSTIGRSAGRSSG